MSYVTIRRLLELRVNTMAPRPDVAFENAPYTPRQGTPYMQLTLLPGKTENPTMGDQFKRETGLLQLSLYYPVNAGPALAYTQAEVARSHFPRGLTLSDTGVRVLIDEHPYVGSAMQDEGWFMVPVSIPYIADVG